MLSSLIQWFNALSVMGRIGVVSAIVATGGIASASVTPQTPSTTLTGPTKVQTTQTQQATCTPNHTTASETQPIPFDSTTVNDPTTAQGQTHIQTVGVDGVKTINYDVTTYTPVGCQPDTKTVTTETITTPPVTQITAVGSYVAPPPPPTPTYAPTQASSCYPLTNGGNCYEPGEYCRSSDHGAQGLAGDGESITCAYNNGWRWEP